MAGRWLGSRQHESRPNRSMTIVACQCRHGAPEMPHQRSCKWPVQFMNVHCRLYCDILCDQWHRWQQCTIEGSPLHAPCPQTAECCWPQMLAAAAPLPH